MKEKTFEELIDRNRIEIDFVPHLYIPIGRVESLLQLVREATIAEVLKLADDNFFSKEPKGKLMANIEEMKTDRIKIKK